ncbi:MAG: dipeptidase [Verrucomicrobiota bacterium]
MNTPRLWSLLLLVALTTSLPAQERDEKLWQEALRIHRSAIVIDGHNDITGPMTDENYDLATPSAGRFHTDLARMKQGGLSAQFFAIYVSHQYVTNGMAARRALSVIDAVYRNIERNPNDLVLAVSVDDIRRAKQSGKIASLMGIENGAAIENSLSVLRNYHRLGVRYMTLTHFMPNDWADASTSPPVHNGLTDFGRTVVREMNRLGMMVDISHVADKTMSDALDVTRAPVIASHSSARALSMHPRNIPDELLKRIAQNGGVVMVNFFPAFIDPRVRVMYEQISPQIDALRDQYQDNPNGLRAERRKLLAALPVTPLEVVMQHIDHIAKVAGVDHVGLGSDFDGISIVPKDISDVSEYPNITYELLKRGYSETDVRKILGENFLRVFAEVERVAKATHTTPSGDGDTTRFPKERRK